MSALRITLAYLVFGSLWVLGSDTVLSLFVHDLGQVMAMQSAKGVLFVGLSGLLIGVLASMGERRCKHLAQVSTEQSERLQHIFDISPAVIYVCSIQPGDEPQSALRVEFVSQRVQEFTGYSVAEFMSTPGLWTASVHPEDVALVSQAQQTLFEQGEAQFRYRFRRKDGKFCWIADQVRLLRDERGHPQRIIGAWQDDTARLQAEQSSIESERRYRELFNLNPLVMCVYDVNTLRIQSVNAAAERCYGYSREEFLEMTVQDLVVEDELINLQVLQGRLAELGSRYSRSGEWRHRCKDGRVIWVEVSGQTFVRNGRTLRLALAQDISDRRQAQERARLIAQVFEASQQAIFITDARARFISVNRAFTLITGYPLSEVQGRTPALLKSGLQNRHFYQAMWGKIRDEGRWEGEIWNRRRNGELYPEWLTVSAVKDDLGRVNQYLGIFTETSSHKQAEARIQRLANYDSVTELPNLALLTDRAQVAIAAAERAQEGVVLAHLNIDQFSEINESLGFASGDAVLKEMARRLERCLPPEATVSRQGSDNFLLLLPHSRAQDVAAWTQRVIEASAEPMMVVSGHPLRLTVRIGVAQYPSDGADLAQLAQSAASAVHQARRKGRGRVNFFSREAYEQTREALAIAHDLRWAVERQQLILHYQPQVDAHTRKLVGLEALVRWQHPEWGMVPPGRFIPVAEETGVIAEVGRWVLYEALRQIAAWQAQGLPVVPVAVNLSVVQFRDLGLRDMVQEALQLSGVDPALLELELTESIAMEDSAQSGSTIASLKALGIQLSIDDFGTGYSSLSYLKRFSVDKLKIDQSFVKGLHVDSQDEAIVDAVIGLAKCLGLRTIAEGVETEEQFSYLRLRGCNEIQGWLLGRAVPADEAARVLCGPVEITGATEADS